MWSSSALNYSEMSYGSCHTSSTMKHFFWFHSQQSYKGHLISNVISKEILEKIRWYCTLWTQDRAAGSVFVDNFFLLNRQHNSGNWDLFRERQSIFIIRQIWLWIRKCAMKHFFIKGNKHLFTRVAETLSCSSWECCSLHRLLKIKVNIEVLWGLEITYATPYHNKNINCYLLPGFIFVEAMIWDYMTLLQRYSKHFYSEAGKRALCMSRGNRGNNWHEVWLLFFFSHICHVMVRSLLENWEEKDHALHEDRSKEHQMPKNDG